MQRSTWRVTTRRWIKPIAKLALALAVGGAGLMWFVEGRSVDYRAAVRGQEYAFLAGPRAACQSDHLIVRYDDLGGLGSSAMRFEFRGKDPSSGVWDEQEVMVRTSGPICAVGAARDGRTFALASMAGGFEGKLVLELIEFPSRPGGPRIVADLDSPAGSAGIRLREQMPDSYEPAVGATAAAPRRRTLYAGTELSTLRILMFEPEAGHLIAVDVDGLAVQFDLRQPWPAPPQPICADTPRGALRKMLRGRWMVGGNGDRYVVLDATRIEGCLRYPGPGLVIGTDAAGDGSFESFVAWEEGEWRSRCKDRKDPVQDLGIRVR